MTASELREKFLEYFKEKGHAVLHSAFLVPEDVAESDKTLFISAGMQQFKRFYANPKEAPSACVTTCQKCIRTGDIDEVGDDTHLTFFEMLGNFSFGYAQDRSFGYPENKGSYFKEEAIKLGWEFLTEILKVNKKRIHATYFDSEKSEKNKNVSTDEESKKILEKIDGLAKIEPSGDETFWSLGSENSPGGPTVEFYIDGIEIWNLVFNEYTLINGKYEPSKYKGVDTGMGLERLLTTLNDRTDVYETDLFELIIGKIEEISGKKYEQNIRPFRIIADHIKAAVFIIADGIVPSNKEAGYIVRRLIRRAVVKANQLGVKEDFTAKLGDVVFEIYKEVYFNVVIPSPFDKLGVNSVEGSFEKISPTVRQSSRGRNDIIMELEKEEAKFKKTLKEGLRIIADHKEATGKILFNLYQSFGLPLEISIEEFNRRGIEVNNSAIEQYNNLLEEHKELSRTASAGMFKGGLAEAGDATTKYHTATHLLLAALQKLIDPNIIQRGSNITSERLRFDFNYPEKLTPEQIKQVEGLVNEQIEKDQPVTMEEMTLDEAKNSGAKGIFESKYGERVKVYTIGPSTPHSTGAQGRSGSREFFSREICGGPHATKTSDLGKFKIKKEESSSAGVRRIKAILE